MSNELYGKIILDVSMIVKSNKENLAFKEGYKSWNEFNAYDKLVDCLKELGLELHNVEVEWERFFGEEE